MITSLIIACLRVISAWMGQVLASAATVAAKGAALGAGLVTSTAKLGVAGARFVFAAGRQVSVIISPRYSIIPYHLVIKSPRRQIARLIHQ